MSVSDHQEAHVDLEWGNYTHTPDYQSPNYLFEHSSLNKVCQEGHHIFVLIFPRSVVQLEIKDWRQSLSLEDDINQDVDDKVCIMGPCQQVDVTVYSITMADSASEMCPVKYAFLPSTLTPYHSNIFLQNKDVKDVYASCSLSLLHPYTPPFKLFFHSHYIYLIFHSA